MTSPRSVSQKINGLRKNKLLLTAVSKYLTIRFQTYGGIL
jgi:hypothetical protein